MQGLVKSADAPSLRCLAAFAVSPLQLVARGDPAGGVDVRALSAVAAERRGSAVRTRDRHLP